MIASLATLLLFQLLGEMIVQFTGVPIPGPVVGMMLLFGGLLWRGNIPETLRGTSQTLLGNLSLLFVPAGVGIMLHVQRVAQEWVAIVLALLLSTLITLAITAMVMTWAIRLTGGAAPGDEK